VGEEKSRMVRLRIMASRSVNKVILIGNLGRDAETAYTASQTAVTKFSVATSRRWKDQQTGEWKEETDWTRVVLWRGENVAPYLTKGTQVYVEGRLQTRSYDDKDGKKVWTTEVVADNVILLGGRGAGSGTGAGAGADEGFSQNDYAQPASGMRSAPRGRQASAPAGTPAEPPMSDGISDDDVPF
jgi:single-strand DNA-binding protein